MKLSEASIRYPVTVVVGVLLAILFGVIALTRLPLQMAPTVDQPVISVETLWEGASPREVEEEVTDRLEEQLNSVEGLNQITSTSEDGKSTITLKFDWGVNKDVARLDVSEKVGVVADLPDDADEPIIKATSSDEETPIAWIVTHSKLEPNELRILGDDVIKPRFERVEGVGTVWMFGGEEREVHVVLDLGALAARRIPVTAVRNALLSENRNVKAGGLDEGKARYVVRTVGQFTTLREIEDTVISWEDGAPVYLRDVGRAEFGYKDRLITVRQMGEPTVVFGILRKTGANTIDVMRGVDEVVEWVNSQYAGKGISLEVVYDETEYIEDAVSLVTDNLWYGALLAVAVLLLFLRNFASTLIVGISIPISIIVTFIVLDLFGRTLNIVSLAGLAFAVGMVVDNAIVVLENIFRHQQMGKPPFRAAFDGAREVWGAILSSTLTTLAVFIPILFIEQEAGQLFKDIAIALSVSIGMSMLVALTVIPMLSSRFLKVKERRPGEIVARGGTFLVDGIVSAVRWIIRGPVRMAGIAIAIIVLSLYLAWKSVPDQDYLPQGNRPMLMTILLTPPGFNIEQREAIVHEIEQRYLKRPEIEHMFAVTLADDPIVGVIIKEEMATKENMLKLKDELQMMSFGIPGVIFPVVVQPGIFARSFETADLEVTVRGPELAVIEGIANRILGASMAVMEKGKFESVQSSYEPGLPELRIAADRVKAAALGLTVSDVGYLVGTVVEGTRAGTFRENGREIDVTMMGEESGRTHTQAVLKAPLVAPTGDVIHIEDVASTEITAGPAKIEHTDLDRSIKISIHVNPTQPLETARGVLEEALAPIRAGLPGLEYTIETIGKSRDLDVTWVAVRGAFLLAVIIVYLLMAALFESFTTPLIVILTVPLALTGGVFGVALAHADDATVKLDVITMLGFVILAGVVVNNAILVVHQALNNIRAGMDAKEGLAESVRSRIRPIFMSTMTSVIGMAPLVLTDGAGSELYRGLGAVVMGGLMLSTVFTLFLTPALFGLALEIRGWASRHFGVKPLAQTLREAHEFQGGKE